VAAVAEDSRQQQLAWEASQRRRAGIAAILAAVFALASPIWRLVALSDAPTPGFLPSLAQALEPGPLGQVESVRVAAYQFIEDHAFTLVAAGVAHAPGLVGAIGLLALGYAVNFLAAATRARRPEFTRLVAYLALVGAVLYAIGAVLYPLGLVMEGSDFLDGARTVDEARDVGTGGLVIGGSLLLQLGPLAMVAGLFLVSLNAMRVGLLTRFLGILGVVSAVLIIIPLIPLPLVLAFWLTAVGLMLLGIGALPPAWRTGNAEPWPTAMEGAQRRREAEDRKQGIVRPEPEAPRERVPAGRPHPSSKKRKRKRRG
jgi:signal transduction histidine kinase